MTIEKLTAIKKSPLLLISVIYFIFRLINLTKLPIFNDEAIYLDWAWRMTSEPGMLFYSLYDAKQPLMMWFFGMAMHLLPEPFFAGRLVSVFCGWLTLVGIFKIGREYFGFRIALLSALLYIFIPIFSFYDRQALMEAGVAAIGVWTVWFALRFWKNGEARHAVFTGILLGVGFFIKSSALVFFLAFFLISIWMYRKRLSFSFRSLFYSAFSYFCVILLLLLQPKFWETLSSNSRYGFGLVDLLGFPVASWLSNVIGNGEIGFLFITPVVFIASLTGLFMVGKKGKPEQKQLALWMVAILLLQIFLVRSTSQRYLVSYLPLLVLFAVYATSVIVHRYKPVLLSRMVWSMLFVIPVVVTLIQVTNPEAYFRFFESSRFSEGSSYMTGRTSGYGVEDAITYIEQLPRGRRIFVGESLYTGTPESAIMVRFAKSKMITVGYLDRRLLGDSVNDVDCIKADVPVYFMSKENDVAGLEKFLENIIYLKNPYNKNIIGIWKMKEGCVGKTLPVQLVNIE